MATNGKMVRVGWSEDSGAELLASTEDLTSRGVDVRVEVDGTLLTERRALRHPILLAGKTLFDEGLRFSTGHDTARAVSYHFAPGAAAATPGLVRCAQLTCGPDRVCCEASYPIGDSIGTCVSRQGDAAAACARTPTQGARSSLILRECDDASDCGGTGRCSDSADAARAANLRTGTSFLQFWTCGGGR